MGLHRVEGTFDGLAKRNDPPLKVTFAGSLDKEQRAQFRIDLEGLAKKYGLDLDFWVNTPKK